MAQLGRLLPNRKLSGDKQAQVEYRPYRPGASNDENAGFWRTKEIQRSYEDRVRDESTGNCKACMKLVQRQDFCHHNVKALEQSAADCRTCRLIFQSMGAEVLARRCSNNGRAPVIDISFNRDRNMFFAKLAGGMQPFELFENAAESEQLGDTTHPWYPLARRWLDECLQSHSRCTTLGVLQSFLPTRLVSIGDGKVHVAATDALSSEDVSYAILSYCWGNERTRWRMPTSIMSTIRNAGEIGMDELPETIQNAVEVARLMGLEYLWIDALCILQDSREDWDRECLRMADYYQSAVFTISALDSASAGLGFLSKREHQISAALLSPEEGISIRSACIAWWKVFRDAPCNRRGWTMQERLLSRRVLHFTKSEIIWECLTCSRREGSAIDNYGDISANIGHSSESPDFKRSLWCLGDDPFSIDNGAYSLWYRIIKFYTMRQLSVPSDKLAAVAGISQFLNQKLGPVAGEYHLGIWTADPHSLLWNCTRPGDILDSFEPIVRIPSAPSWSWASVDAAVTYRFYEEGRVTSETDSKIVKIGAVASSDPGSTERGSPPQASSVTETNVPLTHPQAAAAFLGDSRGVADQRRSYIVIDAMHRQVTCVVGELHAGEADAWGGDEHILGGNRNDCFNTRVYIGEHGGCATASLDGDSFSDLFDDLEAAIERQDKPLRSVRFECTALRIGERIYHSVLHPNSVSTYFLLVLPSKKYAGCWQRIGMGITRTKKERGPGWTAHSSAFDDCERSAFCLV